VPNRGNRRSDGSLLRPLACGDLIAHRRYAYGKAAAEDGDWAAAPEMFAQAPEPAPDWPPAWFALGEARQELRDLEGAAAAFRRTLEADPSTFSSSAGARA
jgi:Flp pilus assembly protein TadD